MDVVDEVEHSIVASTGGPRRIERRAKGTADTTGIVDEGSGYERVGGCCNFGRELLSQ
jgi:hypothetical protein